MKQDDALDYSFRRVMPLREIDFHFAVHAIHSLLSADFALGNVRLPNDSLQLLDGKNAIIIFIRLGKAFQENDPARDNK